MKVIKKPSKKPTMLDVAKRAGVSISSVSRVINSYPGVHPQLRTQVERAIKDLEYLPSLGKRRLQQPRTRLIYFLLANRDLHIPFHSRVLQSIENECNRYGDVVLFRTLRYTPQTPPGDLKIVELLQLPFSDKKKPFPDGVILTGLTYPNLLRALRDAGVPVMLLENNYTGGSDLDGDAVTFDGFQGAYDATRYLI